MLEDGVRLITTSSRTFAQYLWQPIRHRFSRAIREK